jgi:hypothetical protein
MYIILEYLTYLVLISVLAVVLFAASVMLVITKEGARRLGETSRKIAGHAIHMVGERLDARTGSVDPKPAATQLN